MYLAALLLSVLLLFLFSYASIALGPFGSFSPAELLKALQEGDSLEGAVLHYRLWRTAAAIAVGAGLAMAGLALQRLLNNPLVDPYILGISSGSALAYVITLALGINIPVLWYLSTFLGGISTLALVLLLAAALGLSNLSLLVAGVSLSYMFSGVTIVLIQLLGDKIPMAVAWLFGTVAYARPDVTASVAFLSLLGILIILALSPQLESLLLGEEVSAAHGVKVEAVRVMVAVATSLIVSSLVALAGPVGFIGLVAPWLARFVGGAGFYRLLLLAPIMGAVTALGADVTIRLLGGQSGAELPLTAITSLMGAPLLFYLTTKAREVGGL
ncbi:MAG: iron ABC transporter permease [Acidilobaceae archaeon]|nr:iron ABC transporter permease [Acidilobaceae archaeon]MCX8165394.1 iron ABC transporter permease [Acidilobaceae archaeon]MDW7973821.1 iron ABC transporter permease [Sulfolobales archaeon]